MCHPDAAITVRAEDFRHRDGDGGVGEPVGARLACL
jgi:hypothetical protein